MLILWILLGITALFFAATFICFYLAFYSCPRKEEELQKFKLPNGKIYLPFKEQMLQWMQEAREMPHEHFSIRSFDGLTLRGNYYEYAPDAPIELMFHGYRGNAERDLCGGVQRCFALGHSALIVDQRAAGRSEGRVISFGINESRDCLSWIDFMLEHFGADVKILLCGISMGASTVLIAAGESLPPQVRGVLADCGYHSAKEIIKAVVRKLRLPADLLYPLIKIGARLYGGFSLEEKSPEQAMKNCKIPVLFFHGEEDRFVPCEMSEKSYEACASIKKIVTIPKAGHGLCYLVDGERYLREMREFEKEWW